MRHQHLGMLGLASELQIKPEERFLGELFGQEYQDYKKRVPRWLGFRLFLDSDPH
jgi:protein-S-isoprenylcysteine O-methyltransferase Ste14